MDLDNIFIFGGALNLSTNDDVDAVEAALGTRFPDGYREFITTLGSGQFERFTEIRPPGEILREYSSLQRIWREYPDFWDRDPALTPEQLGNAIPLAHTMDGDEIVFVPSVPGMYMLPRHDDTIYILGPDFYSVLDWLHEPNQLIADDIVYILTQDGSFVRLDKPIFEPFLDNMAHAEFLCRMQGVDVYDTLRSFFIQEALEAGSDAILITIEDDPAESATETPEEADAIRVFDFVLKSAEAHVHCQSFSEPAETETSADVFFTYDRGAKSERLNRILSFVRKLSTTGE
jgi:hypothetical protein